MAISKAEASYWKKHADELQANIKITAKPSKSVPKPRKRTPTKQAESTPADSNAVAPRKVNKESMQPLYPSAALAKVVGSSPLPRTEVVSKLWDYIKRKRLQDADEVRMINSDPVLFDIFGKQQVSMFEMAGLIGRHLTDKPVVLSAQAQTQLDPERAWPFPNGTDEPAEAPPKKGWFRNLFS